MSKTNILTKTAYRVEMDRHYVFDRNLIWVPTLGTAWKPKRTARRMVVMPLQVTKIFNLCWWAWYGWPNIVHIVLGSSTGCACCEGISLFMFQISVDESGKKAIRKSSVCGFDLNIKWASRAMHVVMNFDWRERLLLIGEANRALELHVTFMNTRRYWHGTSRFWPHAEWALQNFPLRTPKIVYKCVLCSGPKAPWGKRQILLLSFLMYVACCWRKKRFSRRRSSIDPYCSIASSIQQKEALCWWKKAGSRWLMSLLTPIRQSLLNRTGFWISEPRTASYSVDTVILPNWGMEQTLRDCRISCLWRKQPVFRRWIY